MGTVGLNFGSPTSGQGFDVASTVAQILAIHQAIETPWKNQLAALQAQDAVLSTIGSHLSTLTSNLQMLTDFGGVMTQKEGSSSDNDVLVLTGATSSAAAGSHTIVVNSLAQTSSDHSDAIANASDVLSGSITIGVGAGQQKTITIDGSNNTLGSLAAAINAAGLGVTAGVISDSSGSRLSIVSGTGGAAGQLNITSNLTDTSNNNTAIGIQTGVAGRDGSITVDGVNLSISSNTVSTAIPGVTFQLLAESTAAIQVQITNDNSAMTSAMASVVSAYNAVLGDLTSQEGNNSSGTAQPLFGNPTISLIQQQLQAALLGNAPSGSISSTNQLGLSFNPDGTLAFDQDEFNSALNNDFSDVVGYMQNSGSFGQTLVSTLNDLGTQAPGGAVFLAQQQNSNLESALNDDIANTEAQIATEQTNLTTELNAANQILQSIPSQLNQVEMLYSAITGFKENTGG
jgi:flagellar hook-associated protein 2